MLKPLPATAHRQMLIDQAKEDEKQLAIMQLDTDSKREVTLKRELSEIQERKGRLQMQAAGLEPSEHQITAQDLAIALDHALKNAGTTTDALNHASKYRSHPKGWVNTVRKSQRPRYAAEAIQILKNQKNQQLLEIEAMGCLNLAELTKRTRTIAGVIKEMKRQSNIAQKLADYSELARENQALKKQLAIMKERPSLKSWQAKALELYSENTTITEIAKQVGVRRETISRFINQQPQ